jgi:DNA-directed RNA polymerase specialized sigma24 family protein
MATTAIGIRAKHDLDELYRAHAAEVFRYTYAVLGNRADAEDVTQTTFVNALRAHERG